MTDKTPNSNSSNTSSPDANPAPNPAANSTPKAAAKPLDGVRILAVEQMQALPYATQLLARLGADVVKVEHPKYGESGRSSQPYMTDPQGRQVGATFLRNNLSKRSIGIDIKHPQGRQLLLELAPRFDVFAENFKAGTLAKMGLDYQSVAKAHPQVIYLSVSGFGNLGESPYQSWPAYAGVAEAMSGLYSWSTPRNTPPTVSPLGALGDTGSAVFGVIGVLAALRHRDAHGAGQHVDISMLDCMVALADVQLQYESMGVVRDPESRGALILTSFKAKDGYFMIQVGREHQWEKMCEIINKQEWLTDPRFETRAGWGEHQEDVIRPAIEAWAADKTKAEVSAMFAEAGVAAGPCNWPDEVMQDPHVQAHNMIAKMERTDDTPEPVVTPGNPVKLSAVPEQPDTRVPWLGEHTDNLLQTELNLTQTQLDEMRTDGIIG